MTDLKYLCQSPIEHKFYDALLARLHAAFDGVLEFHFGAHLLQRAHISRRADYAIYIAPQCSFQGFRIDFAIMVTTGLDEAEYDQLLIAIECDGHEWHERTKEQAKRDRSRDRLFAREGWIVQRFTGSEIVGDAAGCAEEIYHLIMEAGLRTVFATARREAALAEQKDENASVILW